MVPPPPRLVSAPAHTGATVDVSDAGETSNGSHAPLPAAGAGADGSHVHVLVDNDIAVEDVDDDDAGSEERVDAKDQARCESEREEEREVGVTGKTVSDGEIAKKRTNVKLGKCCRRVDVESWDFSIQFRPR